MPSDRFARRRCSGSGRTGSYLSEVPMHWAIHIATLAALLVHGAFGCCVHHVHASRMTGVAKVRIGQPCGHHHHGHACRNNDGARPRGDRPDDAPSSDPCHDHWCVFNSPRTNTQAPISLLWCADIAAESLNRIAQTASSEVERGPPDDGSFPRPGAILLQKQSLLL